MDPIISKVRHPLAVPGTSEPVRSFTCRKGATFDIVGQLGNSQYAIRQGFIHYVCAPERDPDDLVTVKVALDDEAMRDLEFELRVLGSRTMMATGRGKFPHMYTWFQSPGIERDFVVMTLLGQNLFDYRQKNDMEYMEALRYAKEALECLEILHEAGYAARNVCPQHFCLERNNNDGRLVMINFSRARKSEKILTHQSNRMLNNKIYASLNDHKGLPLGKRDDLECWVYVLFCLLGRNVPWHPTYDPDSILGYKTAFHSAAYNNPEGHFPGYKLLNLVNRLKLEYEPPHDAYFDLIDEAIERYETRPDKWKEFLDKYGVHAYERRRRKREERRRELTWLWGNEDWRKHY